VSPGCMVGIVVGECRYWLVSGCGNGGSALYGMGLVLVNVLGCV
jgi:hypothetical protein